jgi:hypothetical protein
MDKRLPAAHVVHQGRRRTRLRFAGRRGDEAFLRRLVDRLSALPDVTHVQAYPVTGSVLILHSAPSTALLDRAASAGLFKMAGARDGSLPQLDMRSAAMTVPLVAAGVLSAFAVSQLLRGRVLPPAVTLAWYAATLALPVLFAEARKE